MARHTVKRPTALRSAFNDEVFQVPPEWSRDFVNALIERGFEPVSDEISSDDTTKKSKDEKVTAQ